MVDLHTGGIEPVVGRRDPGDHRHESERAAQPPEIRDAEIGGRRRAQNLVEHRVGRRDRDLYPERSCANDAHATRAT